MLAGDAFHGGMGVIVILAVGVAIDDIAGREMRPFLHHAGAAKHGGHRVLARLGKRRAAGDRFGRGVVKPAQFGARQVPQALYVIMQTSA